MHRPKVTKVVRQTSVTPLALRPSDTTTEIKRNRTNHTQMSNQNGMLTPRESYGSRTERGLQEPRRSARGYGRRHDVHMEIARRVQPRSRRRNQLSPLSLYENPLGVRSGLWPLRLQLCCFFTLPYLITAHTSVDSRAQCSETVIRCPPRGG